MTRDISKARENLIRETDELRLSATTSLEQERREGLGQFLTPASVASLMASMFAPLPSYIRVLDAGAGVGGLTAAFVVEACSRKPAPRAVAVTAFEIDAVLLPNLQRTLARCRKTCEANGLRFSGTVHQRDFLEVSADALASLFGDKSLEFDVAILNPPYRKIGTSSRERLLVQSAGLNATNLYAAFVSLSVRLLAPGGQIVAIMPRSFCNGPYFRPFRDLLLKETTLLRIHLFESRTEAFKDDRVLQENVIVHARKSKVRPRRVVVSSSETGGARQVQRRLDYAEVVREVRGDCFIHLPTRDDDGAIAGWMAKLPHTLDSLKMCVSTGRVVDFRAKRFLLTAPTDGSAPLVYPCHFADGQVRWPNLDSRKPNAIVSTTETEPLLVPKGYYVLTKRFSSKEERRRLVAAVFDPNLVRAPRVGFENHLNYFHRAGRGLSKEEAYGLAAFLNSHVIDRYFRQFNGHTQVNATDLRSLRYPSLDDLCELGCRRLRPGSSELEEAVLANYPLE